MMTGKVYDRQPRIEVAFRLTGLPDIQIEFVIDTGFDGFLTLPAAAVAALNLPFVYNLDARFASGDRSKTSIHGATVMWDGAERSIQVLVTENKPLLGTALLDGYDVFIPFEDGGVITITRR